MKRSFLVLVLTSLLILAGCSSQTEIKTMTFSDYYRNAESFNEIGPQISIYFSCIRAAYDGSNKTNLESFSLPNEYGDARGELLSFAQADIDLSDILNSDDGLAQNIAKEKLLRPFLQIEQMLNEKDVLLSANQHVKNEQWFEDLNALVWNSIDEYRRGTGE